MGDIYLIANESCFEFEVGQSGVLVMFSSIPESEGGPKVPVRFRVMFPGDDFGPFFYKIADTMVDFDERDK